jgi:AICAR transformylase/IMP cyclohydrolase PurH
MDITTATKAINVREGGSTMIRMAARREKQVKINLDWKGRSMLTFN